MAQKVTTGVYKGVTTSELDDLAAETAASMTATHPDYATVCPRLPDPSWKQNHHHEVQSPQVSAIIYVVSRAARGKDSGVKPAQKHHEVLQRDVRRHFKLLRSCAFSSISQDEGCACAFQDQGDVFPREFQEWPAGTPHCGGCL